MFTKKVISELLYKLNYFFLYEYKKEISIPDILFMLSDVIKTTIHRIGDEKSPRFVKLIPRRVT